MPRRTVHLIDASPYIFRAWFSIPTSMLSPEGRPVNAVYGFGSFLIRYLNEQQPSHVGLAFDESLTTSFRNELYPPYKAQRDLPPEELVYQLDSCQRMARGLGAATYVDQRYEADDLIATLCRQLVRKGHEVVVVTVDKDLTQLVGPHVELFDWAAQQRYGPAEVVQKMGVRPEQIPDFLGLAGDAVDNIPGVSGVGKKTAEALLQAYSDLDDIYAHLDQLCELSFRGARTIADKLQAQYEMAQLSRTLATVAYDAPATARLPELAWKGADEALLLPLLDELGFRRMRDRVPRWR